ncbi:unnamed protein product [Choristocarpus tenellus]
MTRNPTDKPVYPGNLASAELRCATVCSMDVESVLVGSVPWQRVFHWLHDCTVVLGVVHGAVAGLRCLFL